MAPKSEELSYRARSFLENEQNALLEHLNWLIEPYLRAIKLTNQQINEQSLEELKLSLNTVDQAIQNKEGWPRFGVKMDAKAGLIVTKISAENHFEINAFPILLDRKRTILERIKILSGEEKLETLQDLLQDIGDNNVREKLQKEVNDFAIVKHRSEAQIIEVEEIQQRQKRDFQQKINELNLFRERSKVFLSFLDREPAATVLGALLLVIFGISIIAFAFTKIDIPDIISGTFFTILGYFFGQSSNKRES